MSAEQGGRPSFTAESCALAHVTVALTRGVRATVLGQATRLLVSLAGTMVLARILAPADYGVMALATAVIGFLALFRDLGLGQAVVQRSAITESELNAVFWAGSAAGLATALAALASAPAVAWVSGEPGLRLVLPALGFGLLLAPLRMPHDAVLRRRLRFRSVAAIDLVAQVAGTSVAVAAAVAGAGVWSLVVQDLVATGVGLVLAWALSPFRPASPRHASGLRDLLRFGANVTGFEAINYLARNADNLLIGSVWGAYALGLYARAYGLLLLPLRLLSAPVGAVATPALARLQHDPPAYRSLFLYTLSRLARLAMPVAVLLAVFAREVVTLLLGARWAEAVPLFRILSVGLFAQIVQNSMGWLYLTSSRPDRLFRWGIAAGGAILLSLVAGIPFGASGVAYAYTATMVLAVVPGVRYATAGTPVTPGDVVRAVRGPMAAALGAALGAVAVRSAAPATHMGSLLAALVFAGAYVLLLRLSLRRRDPGAHVEASDGAPLDCAHDPAGA